MAKKGSNRIKLECSECKRVNYFSKKNANLKNKLEILKFCRHCKKHTKHKETK